MPAQYGAAGVMPMYQQYPAMQEQPTTMSEMLGMLPTTQVERSYAETLQE